MSVWDDELASCDQYAITKLTNKIVDIQACNDKFIKVMQADDVLEIGAEYIRGSNGTRLQVAPDFVTKIESRSKSRQELIGAKHIKTGRYISKPEYESMSDKSGTAPIYRKVCKGAADRYIRIGYSPNELTIKLSKLAHFTKSRHRALIDSIVEDEIFTYTPRQCEQTYKHRYNQARLMLKRRFYIKGYEWGLTFNPAISATLYPLLCRIAVPYKGTFYLYDGKHTQCKIKVYNIDSVTRPDAASSQSFRTGLDRLKFEITYKHEYFRANADFTINRLTLQQEIANILLLENKKLLRLHLLDKLTISGKQDIFTAAGVKNQSELMSLIDDNRSTQVSTDERVRELAKQVELLQQAQAKFAEETAAEFAAIKDFIGYKETTLDSRKLRKV